MSQLHAGFSRVDITPMVGISLKGYYGERIAKGTLDPTEATALALRIGDVTALILSVDVVGIPTPVVSEYRDAIAAAAGLPREAIFIHSVHIHTGPDIVPPDRNGTPKPEVVAKINEYRSFLGHRLVDASLSAIEDLSPATMGYAVGRAENVAYIRRFRMKDGSVKTNPGVGNPEILEPLEEIEERVSVIRFDREGKNDIVLFHFGLHPDVIGGYHFTADWPGFARRTLEAALPDTSAIFLNGCQGDVNHVNVNMASKDYAGGVRMDFTNGVRYDHARYIGRAIAGAVLGVYDKVIATDPDAIRFTELFSKCAANKAAPEQLAEAHRIHELHIAGRDSEISGEVGKGMDFVTVVAEAGRMVRLENGPDFFPYSMTGLSLGNVALIGIPGEPFTGIGRGIRTDGERDWELVLPCCIVNGYEAYFPTKKAYDEGGYEARASSYKCGVAEQMIAEGLEILKDLRK
ncbi:MAG: hypothetical protein IKC73_02650 [Clostridia bacterium]|nr:hypothetical protein [Clostridia bacterium]